MFFHQQRRVFGCIAARLLAESGDGPLRSACEADAERRPPGTGVIEREVVERRPVTVERQTASAFEGLEARSGVFFEAVAQQPQLGELTRRRNLQHFYL